MVSVKLLGKCCYPVMPHIHRAVTDTLASSLLQIKQAWDFAYQQLTAHSDASESLLERIIRVDTVLTDRPRPKDPPVPEQLEQNIRDQMHHKSKRSRQEGAHHERKHKEKRKDGDSSRHRDKKRRRERSLEFVDPDLDAPKDRDRERSKSHRSSSRDDVHNHRREGSQRPSSREDERSHKRHRERDKDRAAKHHKSAHHRTSDRHQSQHIRFSEHD